MKYPKLRNAMKQLCDAPLVIKYILNPDLYMVSKNYTLTWSHRNPMVTMQGRLIG